MVLFIEGVSKTTALVEKAISSIERIRQNIKETGRMTNLRGGVSKITKTKADMRDSLKTA